ncbi:MAG: 3D domain-containing protein [Clostridiales bacterium]|nr:3D domain-containing protein [Clostridiales bacterium]
MRESYNTRFFQFFLVLVITIVVSETILLNYKNEAYARESSESQIIISDSDPEIGQVALESALGSPKALPAQTVAMKAVSLRDQKKTEVSLARPMHTVTLADVQASANIAQEALKEKKAAEEAAEKERLAKEQEEADRLAAEKAARDEAAREEAAREEAEAQQSADTSAEQAAVEETPEDEAQEEPSDNGNYVGTFRLTAYCPCSICCGSNTGITAIGTVPVEGYTIAADPSVLPYGTVVYIEGYGTYTVEDCGNFSSNTIDIFFDSHSVAYDFGVQYANVYIVG